MVSVETDIFEALRAASGFGFISDLIFKDNRPRVAEAVSTLEADSFQPQQWCSLTSYLLGEVHVFGSAAEAKSYLLEKLV